MLQYMDESVYVCVCVRVPLPVLVCWAPVWGGSPPECSSCEWHQLQQSLLDWDPPRPAELRQNLRSTEELTEEKTWLYAHKEADWCEKKSGFSKKL